MYIQQNEPIVAFTLARYPKRASIAELTHLGLDRLPLAFAHGLRFWKLLGVGRGLWEVHCMGFLQRPAML